MNVDQIEILGSLRQKTKKLIELLESERAEKITLKNENSQLRVSMVQQEAKIHELEQKYEKLKLAKAMASDSDEIHDAKIKVNRMVREIDKCIALLNR